MRLSAIMTKALRKATTRPNGKIMPIPDESVRQMMRSLHALDRHGLVEWKGPSAFLSARGRSVAARIRT